MIDRKSALVGALGVTFLAFLTGPFNIRHGSQGGSWVENVFGVQLGGTLELTILAVLVTTFVCYRIYKWIPSRGSKRSWVPDE